MNTIMKYYSVISYHNSWPWKSYFILVVSIMWPATNVYKTHHNIIIQHNVLVLCSDAILSTKFFLTTIGCGPLPSILFCSPESQCLWGIYQAWRSSSSHHHEGLCSTTRSPATFKHTVLIMACNFTVYCAENGWHCIRMSLIYSDRWHQYTIVSNHSMENRRQG